MRQGRLRGREALLGAVQLLKPLVRLPAVRVRPTHLALFQRRLGAQGADVLLPPGRLLLQLLILPAQARQLQTQLPLLLPQRGGGLTPLRYKHQKEAESNNSRRRRRRRRRQQQEQQEAQC